MKKLQYLISILAMIFLLVQSTIGVVSYFNTEEPSQRSGMMGQPPNMQRSTSEDTTQTTTDSSSSSTTDSETGDSSNTQMTPPNGMDGGFPGQMSGNTDAESKSTASLVGYIAGIIVSLGGLVLTLLTWRKKDKSSTIVEN